MIDLFKTEWLRFRSWALAVGLAHLMILTFLDRVADPLQQPLIVYRIYLGALFALGLAFGMVQLSAYARLTAWIELLHRPLSPQRIGASLMLAGLAAIGAAAFLPVLVLLPFHHLTGGQVESRDLLFPMASWLIAALGYLIGVHVRLGPSKITWTSVILIVWLYQAAASGPWSVLVQSIAVCTAFALTLANFRPDRDDIGLAQHLGLLSLGSIAIAAVGTYFIGVLAQIALMFMGIHPLNGIPPKGGIIEATRATGEDLMIDALQTRQTAKARFWADQAALSEIVTIRPEYADVTSRYSLSNPGDNGIIDRESRLSWLFDRDDMRYHAIDQRTRRLAEILPSPVFPGVPLLSGEDIIAGGSVWRYDRLNQRFVVRLSLPPDDRIIAPPSTAWDRTVVLSSRELRLYDNRLASLGERAVPPPVHLMLPQPPAGLIRIDMLELLDSYLVSFTYGADVVDGRGEANQQVWQLDEKGARLVFVRPLSADYPAVMRYRDAWFAPAILAGADKIRSLFGNNDPMTRRPARDVPASIVALAMLVHLMSAAAARMLATNRVGSQRARWFWTASVLVLGPAVLFALLLSSRRKATC